MCSWRVRHQQVRRTHGIPISLAAAWGPLRATEGHWGPLRATEGESKRQKDHSGSDHSPQKDSWQQFSTVFMVTYVTYVTLKGWTDLKRVWMIGMIGEGFGRIPGLWTILNMWISFVIVNTVKACLNYLKLSLQFWSDELDWQIPFLYPESEPFGSTIELIRWSIEPLKGWEWSHTVSGLFFQGLFGTQGWTPLYTFRMFGIFWDCNNFYQAQQCHAMSSSSMQRWFCNVGQLGLRGPRWSLGLWSSEPQHLCDDETWHPSDNPWDNPCRNGINLSCHVMSVEQPRDAWQLSWLQVDARDRLSCYATFHVMWNAKLASKCDRHAIVCSSVLLPCCLSRPYPPFQFWWLWTVNESEEKKTSTVTTETPSISTAERHLPACGGMWHLGMVWQIPLQCMAAWACSESMKNFE